jgi:hypothetical protein
MNAARNAHIAEVVASRINGGLAAIDIGDLPNWIGGLLSYFQGELEAVVFNRLYLNFINATPLDGKLSRVKRNDYLILLLNHVLTSLSMLNQNHKHVKESTLITKEVIEALKRNAGGKEMEALRKRADATASATYATANATAAATANAAAAATAHATYAATYAAAAANATAYAANATTAAAAAYATAYAANAANATAYANATAHAYVTDWSKTKMEALEYYFSSLISLIEGAI